MADSAILQHIRQAAPFAHLNGRQQQALAAAVQAFHCRPDDLLAREGQPLPGLLLLAGGAAHEEWRGEKGALQRGATLRAGDCHGAEALFREQVARVSLVVSAADTWALLLTRAALQPLLEQDSGLLAALQRGRPATGGAEVATFRGQRRGERVLSLRRRHPWAWGHKAFWPALLALLLLIAALVAAQVALTLALAGAALLIPGLWLGYLLAEWHNDHLIITDQRIIRRERTILSLEETLAELPLESVHEVTISIPQHDAFARFFDYGTVFIRTAGDAGNMTLPLMRAPEALQRLLLRNRLAFQERLKARAQARLDENMEALLQGEPLPALPAPPGFAGHAPPGLLSTRFSDPDGNLVYRKHLSVWLAPIFLPLELLILCIALCLIQLLPGVASGASLAGLLGSAAGVGVALLWLYWSDWDWRNDMLFIGQTTLRIIHRRPMWLQDHNEQFLLTQVDSVTISRSGPLNMLLNRGDLLISLVGDDHGAGRNFNSVGRPLTVQEEISSQRAALLARREEREALQRREEFATWIDAWQTHRQRQTPPP